MTDADRPFVLGVDLDGVCADHNAAFRKIVAAERGVDPDSLPLERSWGFAEWGMDQAEFERLHEKAVVEYRMLADLEPIDGAADTLWRLSDIGVWIRVITHRLYVNWGHAIAAGDTAAWLDRVRIPYRDLCFMGAKADVGADLYIDDGPHNVAALRASGRDVIVFEQSYNTELAPPRARTWAEVEELVHDRLTRFTGSVQSQLPGIDAGATRLDRNIERT